jgi:serine/threonine protein kinase
MKLKKENRIQRFPRGSILNGRYEIVRLVGCGGIGEVYQVLDKELENQAVAIKVLHPFLCNEKATLQRFQNEVFIARQLSHPNVVRVYDFAEEEGLFYLTLEYVSGCDLSEVSESYLSSRLPETDALYILRQIAEGLAFAHKRNIVHRDLKPQNILVDKTGLAKLSDFGLAHSIETDSGLTKTGELIGSPAYLAPEQFMKSQPDTRADVYAFGILAYELLCGDLPFNSTSYYDLAKQHREQSFPIDKLRRHCDNDELCSLILECCDKDLERRPRDAQAIAERLTDSSNYERSEKTLKTIVTQRKKDSFITNSDGEAITLRSWMWAIILITLFATALTDSARKRVVGDLALIQQHTGVSTKFLRSFLLFGTSEVPSLDALKELTLMSEDDHDLYEVNVFLNSGVNLKSRLDNETRNTILHHLSGSFNSKINRILRQAKLNHAINERNNLGETPLIRALRAGQKDYTYYILTNNLRLAEIDKTTHLPTFDEENIEVFSGNYFNAKFTGTVVPGADITIPDKEGNYPVHIAATNNDRMSLEYLLEINRYKPRFSESTMDGEGHTALHICVLRNNPETLEYLLTQNFNVDMRDREGRTPLMLALAQRADTNNKQIVALLLRTGASLKARDNSSLTALDYAKNNNRMNELNELNVLKE